MEHKVLHRDEVRKLEKNAKIHGVPFTDLSITPAFLTEEWHNFEFAEEHVLLVTYPKSGTHLMIEIFSLIHSRGDPKCVQYELIWNRSPWIEEEHCYNYLQKNKCSPFITTHLPIMFLPESFFRSKMKVIYVIRNSKDLIVPGYLFWKGVSSAQKAESMDQFFNWKEMPPTMERKVLRREEVRKLEKNAKIHGVLFMGHSITPAFLTEEWHNFEFAEEDVMLVTYPKSGTHWMIEILSLIHCRGDPKWVQSEFNWNRSPWIEAEDHYDYLKKNKCSPFITSHLPIQFMPESFFRSKVKVIYVIRNPKDLIASGYLFWKGVSYAEKAESMDQFFNWFLEGNVPYGSWFDHVHGWLSMREHDNFLLLSYEELKRDLRNTVKKISQFLGVELGLEAIDSVLENCSFQAMKNNNMSNHSSIDESIVNIKVAPLLRKGVTGDWKNHLTVAQAETIDKLYKEKMKDLPSELFPWTNVQ